MDDSCASALETGRINTKISGLDWRAPGFPQTDRHPIVCISWDDATAFAEWLSRRTGQAYRLLTEAEWEYAARAGSTTRFYFGNDAKDLCSYGNFAEAQASEANCRDGHVYTAPVGSFRPNAFGLYDMHGNVWEAVGDCFASDYNGAPNDGSAYITSDCSSHALRGGSWHREALASRAAARSSLTFDYRGDNVGFRL